MASPASTLAPTPQGSIVVKIDDDRGERPSSKWWQLLKIIGPVLLTGWLTFVSSRSETTIRKDIENQNQILSAQLDLTKDLYKRRFDAYEKLYAQLIILNDKLAQLEAGNYGRPSPNTAARLAISNRQMADFLRQLDELRKANGLHMSLDVEKLMGEAWQLGVRGKTEAVRPKIQDVETQMRKELEKQMIQEQKPVKPGKVQQTAITL